jgi:exonuclease III
MSPFVYVVFFATTVVAANAVNSSDTLELRCVSWNINGAQKFTSLTPELSYMENFDVILLQETFTLSPENGLDLIGYIPYHVLGRLTGGRPSWGLSTLLRIDSFTGGTLRPLPSPMDWLQVTRWRRPSDKGLLIINVYFAVYTDGFQQADSRTAIDFLTTLRSDYPGDGVIMGGDFNYDPWRTDEHRVARIPITSKTRYY